jgi:hypothetical protein
VTLTPDELIRLARAAVSLDPAEPGTTLRALGDPDPPALATAAFEHMSSDDRNVRVAMLRVLALSDGPDAVRGILAGLDDPVKRVREVAAKSSVRFVTNERVAQRLQRAIQMQETGSSKPAFDVLSGLFTAPYSEHSNPMLTDVLASLIESRKHQPAVLTALLRTPLTDEVRELLREIIEQGTKQEAILATRRLCGYRIARLEEFSPERQAVVRRTCERAWGSVWYWVPEPEPTGV